MTYDGQADTEEPDYDWLAIVQCPHFGTWHVTMVDFVDEDGDVRRSHDASGEAFETDRAFRVGNPRAVNVLACIRALPGPYWNKEAAVEAVMTYHKEHKP